MRPDGKFSYPLAGEINAVGHTVAQVEEQISGSPEKVHTGARGLGVGQEP